MRRPLHFGVLLQLAQKEKQFASVKSGTVVCAHHGLHYGLSFYGPAIVQSSDRPQYKRVEIWCRSCPTPKEFDKLHKLFTKNVPKTNNTVFAYVDGQLFEVR